MSTLLLGKTAQLLVGTSSTATKVDVTGVAVGAGNISRGVSRDNRRIPAGRGGIVTQLGDFRNYDFAFGCDSNATHDPVFRRANGRRLWCTFRPNGDTSGETQFDFEAVARVGLAYELAADSSVWSVSLAVDGEPTASTI